MKRLVLVGMMTAALAMAPKAEAATMSGGFSIVNAGFFTAYNGPGYTNPSSTITNANVLDFGANGSGTGTWAVSPGACSGSFVGVLAPCNFGVTGTIKDIDVSGGIGANIINSFMTGPNGLVLNLASVTLIDRGISSQLTIKGLGSIIANGFDATPVSWNFTGNDAAGTFSWSSSQATVPEPGSLVLFGTGLIGLASAARRRMRTAKA